MEWDSYESFCERFRQHDICILPINLNPYTRCKSNNRLALSLLLGVPVVADTIPSYEEFERYCLLDNWHENLRTYLKESRAAPAARRSGQRLRAQSLHGRSIGGGLVGCVRRPVVPSTAACT
jgi:hypothetical protein